MIKNLINKIAQKLGRENYSIDSSIANKDLLELLLKRTILLIRFYGHKIRFKKSYWAGFISSKVTIDYARNLILGRSIFIGEGVKINALCKSGVIIGDNVTIKAGSSIDCSGVLSNIGNGISIGDRVGISENCFIQVRGFVSIENDVIIGPNVKIFSENHKFDDTITPIRLQGVDRKGVKITKGSWIGSNAIILDGVTIGKNSVVAAGSVVTKNTPDYSVVGGNPAKIIRYQKNN